MQLWATSGKGPVRWSRGRWTPSQDERRGRAAGLCEEGSGTTPRLLSPKTGWKVGPWPRSLGRKSAPSGLDDLVVVYPGKKQSGALGLAGLLRELRESETRPAPALIAATRWVRFPGTADGGAGGGAVSRTGFGVKGEGNQHGLETEQERGGELGRHSFWKEGQTRGPIRSRRS